MSILGKWLLNENLTAVDKNYTEFIAFTSNGKSYIGLKRNYYVSNEDNGVALYYFDNKFAEERVYLFVDGWTDEAYRTIEIIDLNSLGAEDTSYLDDFSAWLELNASKIEEETKPLAEITYNGETIAQLNAGETATLSCKDKKMVSDVVVKVNEVEGGSSGECSGDHIIEVDELPTENIDESAVYLQDGKYHKYLNAFTEVVIAVEGEEPILLVEMYRQYGMTVECYTVSTKPTEDIQVTDFDAGILSIYYVEDENDIFAYMEDAWVPLSSEFGTFGGAITSIDQATENGYCYALIGKWTHYIVPRGVMEITSSGGYDVTENAFAYVNVPTPSGSTTITENGEYDVTKKAKAIVNVPIPSGYVKPSGSVTITENSTVDVTNKATVVVNVEDSPLPIELPRSSNMINLESNSSVGEVYKYTGATTGSYETNALYVIEALGTTGRKVPKKLVTEENVIGTWVFNDVISSVIYTYDTEDEIKAVFANDKISNLDIEYYVGDDNYRWTGFFRCVLVDGSLSSGLSFDNWLLLHFAGYDVYTSGKNYINGSINQSGAGWTNTFYKTIHIVGGKDIYNEAFIAWLKANATKQ